MLFELGLRFAAANRQRLRMKFFWRYSCLHSFTKTEAAILRLFMMRVLVNKC